MKDKLKKSYQLVQNLIWILSISRSISKIKFIVRVASIVMYAVLPMLSYWMLKTIIDSAVQPKIGFNQSVLGFIIAFKLLFDLAWLFLDSFLEGLFKIMRFDMEAKFISLVMTKLNNLDISFFENSAFLDLKQKTLDTYTSRPTEFLNVAFWSFYNILQIVFQCLILLTINSTWIFMLFLFQIPALIILLKIGQSAWNIWDADSTTRRKFTYFSGLFSNLSYIKEFALYNLGTYFLQKITSYIGDFHTNQKKIEHRRIFLGFGGTLLSNLPVFYITFNLLFMTIKHQISPGLLTFYLSSLAAFSLALQNLIKNINYGYEINLYIKEIRRFLSIRTSIHSVEEYFVVPIKFDCLSIEFKNISFKYPESKRNVFTNFSLKIEPYKKIALVGENGSGKTTLMKLLCRFYDVQKGEILINGVNIRTIPLMTLRSWFSVLFQDYVGYDLTVSENIALGNIQNLSKTNRIHESAKMAGADKFIEELPAQYNQLLGTSFTHSEQLSVGQWQRIALAKAFMRNSPIIVLDEPTSSIDAKTEHEIFNRVLHLIRNKTVLMISHRFSTVRKADEIIVLKNGEIIERGIHETLIEKKGEYAQMFSLQSQAYM